MIDLIELDDLEREVTERWMAAAQAREPDWPMPDNPIDFSDWVTPSALPDNIPQFPREQWARYPGARRVALTIADGLLGMVDLPDTQWMYLCMLMLYSGKTRIA